jgi:hypothetical protein
MPSIPPIHANRSCHDLDEPIHDLIDDPDPPHRLARSISEQTKRKQKTRQHYCEVYRITTETLETPRGY